MKLFERKQYLANQTDKDEEYSAETYQEMKDMNLKLGDERNAILQAYQSKGYLVRRGEQGNNIDQKDKRANVKPRNNFKNLSLIEYVAYLKNNIELL